MCIRDSIVRYGAVTRDGRPDEAVIGIVMMLRDANSGKVVSDVRDTVLDIQKTLPPGMTIDGYYARTELVDRTIHTVVKNLLEASALVLVVLSATLVNVRAALVVA